MCISAVFFVCVFVCVWSCRSGRALSFAECCIIPFFIFLFLVLSVDGFVSGYVDRMVWDFKITRRSCVFVCFCGLYDRSPVSRVLVRHTDARFWCLQPFLFCFVLIRFVLYKILLFTWKQWAFCLCFSSCFLCVTPPPAPIPTRTRYGKNICLPPLPQDACFKLEEGGLEG